MGEIISFPNLKPKVKNICLRQEYFEKRIAKSFLDIDLETTSIRFVQPGITNLYKKHLNPVKCWYLELRHVLHFYNHSKRHRWIVEKFLDDEFKTDIITACEIDMYELYKKCEYWCEQVIEQKLQLNSSFRVAKKVMGELDLWKNKFNSVEYWTEEDSFNINEF